MNLKRITMLLIVLFSCGTAYSYSYDANDFACEVVSYYSGEGASFWVLPQAALGRPSIDTVYSGVLRPVVPVYPEYRPSEIVTVGIGGHLVLKFNHKVCDDEKNPYGMDFIVFGNAMMEINGSTMWNYGDPAALLIASGLVGSEFGRVSVSQNGVDWFSFSQGPFADSFAPTLGRVYDPNNPCGDYPGWNNLWWSGLTDPTLPLDPNVRPEDFAGKTLAYFCYRYGNSAGGTAFDLKWLNPQDYLSLAVDPVSGSRWIQYIAIDCNSTDPDDPLPEIDAVSDVSCCGDYRHPIPAGDINYDCKVDMIDLEIMCLYWLYPTDGSDNPAKAADLYKDTENIVDFRDFCVLANSWLQKTWQ